jgi:Zinc finger, C3HC4 type (RING finger)
MDKRELQFSAIKPGHPIINPSFFENSIGLNKKIESEKKIRKEPNLNTEAIEIMNPFFLEPAGMKILQLKKEMEEKEHKINQLTQQIQERKRKVSQIKLRIKKIELKELAFNKRKKRLMKDLRELDSSTKLLNNQLNEQVDYLKKKFEFGKPQPEKLCVICLVRRSEYALIPCGHMNYCVECCKNLKNCAVCRTDTNNFLKVFE